MGYNSNPVGPTNFEMVEEFHRKFDVPVGVLPNIISAQRALLRVKLIEEEQKELVEAITRHNLVGIAKEACDLLVVTYGTLVEYGINADHVFEEVHKSNMSKLGADGKPIHRADGKVLKGPLYQKAEPAIKEYLVKRGWKELDDFV